MSNQCYLVFTYVPPLTDMTLVLCRREFDSDERKAVDRVLERFKGEKVVYGLSEALWNALCLQTMGPVGEAWHSLKECEQCAKKKFLRTQVPKCEVGDKCKHFIAKEMREGK